MQFRHGVSRGQSRVPIYRFRCSVAARRALVRQTLVIGQLSASYVRDMFAFRTEGAVIGRKLEVARLTRASLIAPALKMAT